MIDHLRLGVAANDRVSIEAASKSFIFVFMEMPPLGIGGAISGGASC
jgi:hypothetical protein